MKSVNTISSNELADLKTAIGKAEKRTSGEIRVFIENHSEDGPLDRAAFLFDKLGMGATELRNGVLVYVALKDHKFCIIGDRGIHEKVGADFWNHISAEMARNFKEGRFFDGLMVAIHKSGEALSKHFPYLSGDKNELSDDVILGDN